MNMPPEPNDPDLLERMREGLCAVATNLVPFCAIKVSVAPIWIRMPQPPG